MSITDTSCYKDIYMRMNKGPFYRTLPYLKNSIESLGDLRDR